MEFRFILIYVLAAFLSGSVPWSWIIGKSRGVDIRNSGSGNTGATNLLRTCGTGPGLAGLALDALKGALPVYVAMQGISGFSPPATGWTLSVVAIFAVLGHVFSPWLGFRGGKGVATALGVLVVLSPLSVACGLAVFAVVLAVFRYVSLSSILAAVSVIPSVFIFEKGETAVQILICLVAVLIIIRHKSNILKLVRGEENRFSLGRGNRDG